MKRVLTAGALIPIALYLIWWAPPVVFSAATIIMGLLCYTEYSGIVAKYGIERPGILGIFAGLLILLAPQYALVTVSLLVVGTFFFVLHQRGVIGALSGAACVVFGVVYAIVPWRFASDLRYTSVHLLFFALALNWAGDTTAYYVGRRFGRHKLAPTISPNKSWEGAIASVAGSLVFGLVYLRYFIPSLAWWEISLMAVLGNVAGQCGDLAESAMKRGAGVKDSGNILPGHGGMLDRVDSSLFALPIVYALYIIWKHLPE